MTCIVNTNGRKEIGIGVFFSTILNIMDFFACQNISQGPHINFPNKKVFIAGALRSLIPSAPRRLFSGHCLRPAMASSTGGDFKRKYMDGGDGQETRLKRQQFFDSNSCFGAPSGSSLMYSDSHAYGGQPPPFPVVRVRGLPFDCVESDVLDFFHGLHILDILFVHKNNRFNGEAFCVLAYPLQVDFAIQRNMRNMGRRYIEVFRSKRQEYYSAVAHEVSNMKGNSPHQGASRARSNDDRKDLAEHTGVLRMRGLPYSAGKYEILDFFKDYELSENNVHVVLNSEGRPSGEGFIEFATAEDSKSAMGKDRMTLGSRYIELFPSTAKEMNDAISRAQ